MKKVTKEDNLAIKRPDLVKEWHSVKNGKLTPWDVYPFSGIKRWWKCKLGHEFNASPNSRNARDTGCPYCSNQKVCIDNCLATLRPDLAKEWHFGKNGKLNPNNVVWGSNKKVWWICKNKHEWQTNVSIRSRQNTKCPYCQNRKICKDNCLKIVNPKLAKEWDFKKNYPLTPNDVFPLSGKKVGWICKKNNKHKWITTIAHRAGGTDCPYCNKKLASKENCLKTANPALFKEVHPTKNKHINLDNVIDTSGKTNVL